MTAALRALAAVLLPAALAAALLAPADALADGSLRCPGGIVSTGDARIDLLARCGPPALRDRRVDDRWSATGVRGGATAGRRVSVVIEEWSYDFGPDAFTALVRLENGRIVDVARGTYGRRQDPPPERLRPPRASCDEHAIHEGDGKLELLSRCGEPAVVDAWDEVDGLVVTDAQGLAAGSTTSVRIERWTYDFGRNHFLRFVRIENGRVTAVHTGGYGYAD